MVLHGIPWFSMELLGFGVLVHFSKMGQKDAQGSISPLRVRIKGVSASGATLEVALTNFLVKHFCAVYTTFGSRHLQAPYFWKRSENARQRKVQKSVNCFFSS